MRTVSAAAAKNSHLKNVAKGSLAIIPLNNPRGADGCMAKRTPAKPKKSKVPTVRNSTRRGWFFHARSSKNINMMPAVRPSSGKNHEALARFA